jgi:hypothetical protein
MGVIHLPTRDDTVMGRVGQNSVRDTTEERGLGSRCLWFSR